MVDELKYPKVYALLEMKEKAWYRGVSFNEISGYLVSPCYLVSESINYNSDGESKKTYEVVFPRDVATVCNNLFSISKADEPQINFDNECVNSLKVDFVTLDYEEAIKARDEKIKEKVFGNVNFILPTEPIETYADRQRKYMEKIEIYQQRLNKHENIEQVKKKVKVR